MKSKLKREKREIANKKILDLEGDLEILREKLKDESREGEITEKDRRIKKERIE